MCHTNLEKLIQRKCVPFLFSKTKDQKQLNLDNSQMKINTLYRILFSQHLAFLVFQLIDNKVGKYNKMHPIQHFSVARGPNLYVAFLSTCTPYIIPLQTWTKIMQPIQHNCTDLVMPHKLISGILRASLVFIQAHGKDKIAILAQSQISRLCMIYIHQFSGTPRERSGKVCQCYTDEI